MSVLARYVVGMAVARRFNPYWSARAESLLRAAAAWVIGAGCAPRAAS